MRSARTADEKFNIVMESLKSDISITELCRKNRIAVSLFYKRKDEFFEGARKILSGENAGKELEKENQSLNSIFKKLSSTKNFDTMVLTLLIFSLSPSVVARK
jgi:transposase